MQEIDDMKLEPTLIWTRIQHSGKPGSCIDVIKLSPNKISMVDHQISRIK